MTTAPTSRFVGVERSSRPVGADRRALFDRVDDRRRQRAKRHRADHRARSDATATTRCVNSPLRLDGVTLETLEVPRERMQRALDATYRNLCGRRWSEARETSRACTRHSCPSHRRVRVEPGVVVGRRPDPLGRVGVYAPGGRAAYPSSVLMGAFRPAWRASARSFSARLARDADARSRVVLAAAALAGADRVFAIGGAGAVAAMAFGTESVPRVDRIVGPGNAYVAEAKLQVSARSRSIHPQARASFS